MAIVIDAALDLHGIFGMDAGSRTGLSGIEVRLDVDCDLSAEERARFVATVRRRCPVLERAPGQACKIAS